VLDARFSPDGSWLLVAGIDNRVSIFDARTGQHRGASPPMDDYCEQVAWIGRTSSFLAASQRGELWVIDSSTMSVTRKILGPDPEYAHLGGVAASADGTRAFLSCGRRLGAFDIATGRIVWRVEEALYNGGRLAASPRGDVLVMAGYDGVAVVDATSGRLGPRYQFPCASGVAWPEPSGAGRPSLLDKLRGRDEDFDDGLAHHSWTARPAFSPSGDVCAVQDHVGNLCFIDGTTLALHPTPRVYGRAFIEDIAWFPDGNHVLLGASDNSLAVWRVRPLEGLLRCEAIGELPPEAYANAAYIQRDARDYDDDDDHDDDDD
jgi:WD40 repeat protein